MPFKPFSPEESEKLITTVLDKGAWRNQRPDLAVADIQHNIMRIPKECRPETPIIVIHPETALELAEGLVQYLQDAGFEIQTDPGVPEGFGYWIARKK